VAAGGTTPLGVTPVGAGGTTPGERAPSSVPLTVLPVVPLVPSVVPVVPVVGVVVVLFMPSLPVLPTLVLVVPLVPELPLLVEPMLPDDAVADDLWAWCFVGFACFLVCLAKLPAAGLLDAVAPVAESAVCAIAPAAANIVRVRIATLIFMELLQSWVINSREEFLHAQGRRRVGRGRKPVSEIYPIVGF
jgi:hypothetical protein